MNYTMSTWESLELTVIDSDSQVDANQVWNEFHSWSDCSERRPMLTHFGMETNGSLPRKHENISHRPPAPKTLGFSLRSAPKILAPEMSRLTFSLMLHFAQREVGIISCFFVPGFLFFFHFLLVKVWATLNVNIFFQRFHSRRVW